jgi:hypothetical protein
VARPLWHRPRVTDDYMPPSDFLQSVIAEVVPLSGSEFGDANLRLLIKMTRDPDRANRDWATMLLSQQEVDTTAVRSALIAAAGDEYDAVRAEAALGLAQRDPRIALPFVQAALGGDTISMPMLEAAALCAHPSLIADLRVWSEPSGNESLDAWAAEALKACERANG